MSPLPHTDLSAGLVVTDSYQDSIYAAASRLRHVARVAGLRLTLGTPDESATGHLPLGEISESTTRELAALLTHQAPAPLVTGTAESIARAAACLRAATQAAKIDLPINMLTPEHGSLQLGEIDRNTAVRLADLIEASLADLYRCAQALLAALRSAGLLGVTVSADGGAVELSEISVHNGVVLLRALEPGVDLLDVDPDDQLAGEELANRLTMTVRTITGGGFLDAAYTPYCRRCGEESAILLGRLFPHHATALTVHLTQAAR